MQARDAPYVAPLLQALRHPSMYKAGEEIINNGLGVFTRTLLGLVAGAFGLVMVTTAPPTEKAIFFYAFAVLCISISCACFFKGRVRQFFGSIIGFLIFIVSIGYLVDQIIDGPLFSARSEQSLVNAIIFMVCFGVPGISYVLKSRFGFGRSEP